MSIFEDKKHNSLAFIGQKPVSAEVAAGDRKDATNGLINRAVEQPMSTRNLPPKD